MIKVLHLSDIHLGSGFVHGRINPKTGLNTRLEDFVATLGRCIDRALAEPVDLVLFGGDAFPDATPPPYIQQAFARQFQRLVEAKIPTVLLVGNHDQHSQGAGGASLCIYRTLGVPNVRVGDRLDTHTIETRNGTVQVITLPWLTRSTLLTRPETEGLSMLEVGQLLLDRLRVALEGEIRNLNPDLPTILLAHLMTDTATYGAERLLAVGKGFTIPLSFLTRECFDYVALGHVHKHQILCKNPFVVYPGSIERVDFSEEKEDKGFVLVELNGSSTTVEFCPLPVRSFRTIKVDLSEKKDPQAALIRALKPELIQDAVVRLHYQIRPEQLDHLDDPQIHKALEITHSYTIQSELVSYFSRSRLPELGVGAAIEPFEALKTYLSNRDDLRDLEAPILEAARRLLAQQEPLAEVVLVEEQEAAETQLRLL
ncbi:exonuclease subunit SbcD [Myxacorys almedinensis]|uniref:Nuclease SbcCD subunit D n=1 Tax=Myxacorys almedinensis A TaxID=2690445 RepID=A0A8J7Z0D4_9CYAN|nr:exonuclease subunit SbcD [Myxacorys almedinensis]NDJ17394.1 exonuclease subunit SbcD [Myxacorys almedinensis A]